MPQRVVLVYQAGIANVFEVEQFVLEGGSKRKRLMQHSFTYCEMFARGMVAAGATVMTAGCNQAGDIADATWTGNPHDLPFAAKFNPVGEWLTQSMPGRTPEQVDALYPEDQVYCVTLTVAAPDQDIHQFTGDVQRTLYAEHGVVRGWFDARKTDQRDHNDSVFELEIWRDPSESDDEGADQRLLDGHNFGETIRQQVVSEVSEALGMTSPIFRILSVDGPDFQNDPRDPFEDEDDELGGEDGV